MTTTEQFSRRGFLRGRFVKSLQTESEQLGFNGIRPPWAVDNVLFVESCTRCGDCIAACETQIIVKGEGGFPEIHFSNGECTFCQKCVQVCEQPVFRAVTEQPWQHKVEIGEGCLTQHRIECRSCQDSCPMSAIRFRLQMGGVAQPVLGLESCNGCGACLSSCPVNAITIRHLDNNE